MFTSVVAAGVLEVLGQGSSQVAFNWWLRSSIVNNLSVVFISDLFIALFFVFVALVVVGRLVGHWNAALSARISQMAHFAARGSSSVAGSSNIAPAAAIRVQSDVVSLQSKNINNQNQKSGAASSSSPLLRTAQKKNNNDAGDDDENDGDAERAESYGTSSTATKQEKQNAAAIINNVNDNNDSDDSQSQNSTSNNHFTGAPDVTMTVEEIWTVMKSIFLSDRMTVAWLILAGLCDCALSLCETYSAGHILVLTQLFLKACEPILTWLFALRWRALEAADGSLRRATTTTASATSRGMTDNVGVSSASEYNYFTSINASPGSESGGGIGGGAAAASSPSSHHRLQHQQNNNDHVVEDDGGDSKWCPFSISKNRLALSVVALVCVAIGISFHFVLEIKEQMSSDAGKPVPTAGGKNNNSSNMSLFSNATFPPKKDGPAGFVFMYAVSVVGSALYAIAFGRYIFLVRRLALHIDPLDLVDLHRGLEHDRLTEYQFAAGGGGGGGDGSSEYGGVAAGVGGGYAAIRSSVGGTIIGSPGGGGGVVDVADDPQMFAAKRRSSLNSNDDGGFGWDSASRQHHQHHAHHAITSPSIRPAISPPITDRHNHNNSPQNIIHYDSSQHQQNQQDNNSYRGSNLALRASFATSTDERQQHLQQALNRADPGSMEANEALALLEQLQQQRISRRNNNNNNNPTTTTTSMGGGGDKTNNDDGSNKRSPSAADVRMVACALETTLCLFFSLVLAPTFEFLPGGIGTANSWSDLGHETHQGILALFKGTSVLLPALITLAGWILVYGADSVLNHISAPLGALINQLTTPLTAIVILIFPKLDPSGTNPADKVPESLETQLVLKVMSVLMLFVGSVLMFLAEKARRGETASKKAKSASSTSKAGKKKTASPAAAISKKKSINKGDGKTILSRIKSYDDIRNGRVFNNFAEVQALIDELPYNTDDLARCPKEALKVRKVHCLDGALLACAALKGMGYPAKVSYVNADDDDGHALCVFTSHDGKYFGAIGKSNFVGLRYREPVYASMRELIMSYFDNYFNIDGKRTMRGYTNPIDLKKFDKFNWEEDNDAVLKVEEAMYDAKEFAILTKQQAKNLCPVDERCRRAGMLGIDLAGCYGAKG